MNLSETIEKTKQDFIIAKNNADSLSEDYKQQEALLLIRIRNLRETFENDNAELIESLGNANKKANELRNEITNLVIEYYGETGNKTFDENLSIRVNTQFQIDEDKAKEYAISHNLPSLLEINKQAVVAGHKAFGFDFVETTESKTLVMKKM